MEEKESQARALLDKTNRQFNECNALYHAAAQRCGLSDAAFWTLYALVTSCEPLTQNRIAADWGIPKQTLNSAVAAMVKKGLLALCPGKGAHSGKIVEGLNYLIERFAYTQHYSRFGCKTPAGNVAKGFQAGSVSGFCSYLRGKPLNCFKIMPNNVGV